MRKIKILQFSGIMYAMIVLFSNVSSIHAQDALASVSYTIKNVRLSEDRKAIAYDVYLKDVDADKNIAVPAFTFRLLVPISDIGSKDKIVTVSNGTKELGAANPTIKRQDSYWLMKFNEDSIALTYKAALKLSSFEDGTLIGTYTIRNSDGSVFKTDQFTALFAGSGILRKSTVAVLKPNTVRLANNSTTAQPESNIRGLGVHYLSASSVSQLAGDNLISLYPNPTTNGFRINDAAFDGVIHVTDLNGKRLLSKNINGNTYVDVAFLTPGVYFVELNDQRIKLIKK